MYQNYENQNCNKCVKRYGTATNGHKYAVECDQVSKAICKGLACPLRPDWKNHIKWGKIVVKQTE